MMGMKQMSKQMNGSKLILSKVFLPVGVLVGVMLIGVGGCSSTLRVGSDEMVSTDSGHLSGSVDIQGASYQEVFDAARAVIGSYRFSINRVDASRGVITTHPKRTVGMGSLWDHEQSTLGQEIEELANQQERTIRVEFERNGSDGDADASSSVRAVIHVLVSRVHRPNWRVETESIRLSTHARSRDAGGRIEPRDFREPIGHDPALARRIAQEISARFE